MKIKLSLLIISLFTAGISYAQELKLVLAPLEKTSMKGCSVSLFHLPDSVLIGTKISDSSGCFMPIQSKQSYFLVIKSVQYKETRQFIKTGDKDIRLSIKLIPVHKTMSEVIVSSHKSLIKEDDDKTVVDAEILAGSSTNAYEVLEKTPGAIVDQDGNVYLSSTTAATIQINGKEIKLSAADLSSLLKSLPAASVGKIEILRSPSSKYDAASSGGIVNIVLKKGTKIGTSGSMNASYFQGIYSTKSAGFTINNGGVKNNSYFSYQMTDKNNYEIIESGRTLTQNNNILLQNARTTYPATTHYFNGGTDLTLSKKWGIAFDTRIIAGDNRSKTYNLINIENLSTNLLVGNNQSDISNRTHSLFLDNTLTLKKSFDSIGSEWKTMLEYNYFNSNNNQSYNNIYYLPIAPHLEGDGTGNNRKNIWTFQSDLVLKSWHQLTLETGFKWNHSNSNSLTQYFTGTTGSIQTIDPYQTNTFKYTEDIQSFYFQLSRKIGGFTIKPGIRMEATALNGHQLYPTDTSFGIHRTDFFPYLFLKHHLFKLFGFDINANGIIRRSITRPYYESLNPYPKYVDQYLYDVGNPHLQPQFTTNYEFNLTADEYTVFSLGLNKTDNIFGNVTYQNDNTGIAYRTYDNLGSNKEVYLRFVGGIPPGGKYYFYAGGQENINTYHGAYDNHPLDYTRSSWVFFMFQNLKVSNTLNISTNGFLRLKGLMNFYELQSFGALNFNINQAILHKKANIILSFNDVLGTNKTNFSLDQGNLKVSGTRSGDTRRIGLTLRYNFGFEPKQEKKEIFESPADNKESQ